MSSNADGETIPNVPVSVTTGIVTRQWSIVGSPHVVSLRHSTITGFRYLLLNGAELHGTEGSSNIFNAKARGDTVTLQVDRFFVEVTITPKGKTQFLYSCKVNGRLQRDSTMIPFDPNFQPEFQIKIPGVIRCDEQEENAGDKGVGIYYRVDTIRTRDGKGACNLRRFKHFAELNSNLKSSIIGCHMVKSLPKFPAKGIKFLKRHDDPKFVEDRRKRLSEYLTFLSRIQLISRNVEFLRFLGITDAPKPKYKILGNGTYVVPPDYKQLASAFDLRQGEYAVTFPLGPLGVVLKSARNNDTTCPTLVSSFKNNKDGTEGAAQRSGKITIGDALSRVNGTNVYTDAQMPHRARIARIKAASRPLELHFIRGSVAANEVRRRQKAAEEAAAAEAAEEDADKEEFEISDLYYQGEDLCLTLDGRVLAFTPVEVKHYSTLWESCGAEDGTLGGGEGFEFFVLSGLSEDNLAEVWRLSSGGRSLAELHKNNFFAALKFVALAQTGKEIVLESLFAPNPDGALALPVFDLGEEVAAKEYEETGEDELIF